MKIYNELDSLMAVLDEERVAILTGNLEIIGKVSQRKLEEVERLNDNLPYDKLEMFQEKMRRNLKLLKASRDGFEIVHDKILALKKIERQEQFYSQCENGRPFD